MPSPLSSTELESVLAPFERATSLPARAYFDGAVLELEERMIFDRSWVAVGREDEVAMPGEWVRAPLTREGVLVVRGHDLELRAFYNVCRHRATPLVLAPCGRDPTFRCPYHGWAYDSCGALAEAPNAPNDLDRQAHALSPLRIDTWQGFVFVTASDDTPALRTYLRDAPPWLLETPLDTAKLGHRSEYDVAANWKLLVENFQESHHFTRIHPALERLTPNGEAESRLGDGAWLGGTMKFAGDVETVSMSGQRRGRPFLATARFRHQVSDAMLFPTLLTSLQPDYFLTYRLYPFTPEITHVVADVFVHPGALTPQFDPSDIVAFWGKVNAEDRAICERQQLGLRSRGYTPTRYARVEEGVHAFDQRVAKALLP